MYGADDVPVAEGSAGALFGSVVRATEIHGEAGSATTRLTRRRPPSRPARGRGRPDGAILRAPARAGRDRADRAAHEHRAAAPAPPGARAADRPPLPDGRLDRRREHDGLGRVQHLRRPRGRGDRVRVRPADHDDGPRRDPPGPARPVARRRRCATPAPRSGRIAAELADFALAREGQWYGTPRMSVHDAVAVAHLAIPDLVDVARVRRPSTPPTGRPAAGRSATACRTGCGARAGRPTRRSASASTGPVRGPPRRRLRAPAVSRRHPRPPGLRPGPRRRPRDHARARPARARGAGHHDRRRQRRAARDDAQHAPGPGAARPDRGAGRGRGRDPARAAARDRRRRPRRERARRRRPPRAALRGRGPRARSRSCGRRSRRRPGRSR